MKTSFLTIVLASVFFSAQLVHAGTVTIPGFGSTLNVKVKSFKEKRFQDVIKQQYDFSCGSAALATLLTYHYNHQVNEREVFEAMYSLGDQEKINREGFSMLDMKVYLESIGFKANGYRLTLEQLSQKARIPVIAIINTRGYNHFVVVKGYSGSEVLVADPAMGNRAIDKSVFEKNWNGLVFLVNNHLNHGRASYDQEEDWKKIARAPLGKALSRGDLAQFTLSLPGPMDF